jgi:hypothetical protein
MYPAVTYNASSIHKIYKIKLKTLWGTTVQCEICGSDSGVDEYLKVFRDVMPCWLAHSYQCFRDAYWLHLQGLAFTGDRSCALP